MKSFHINLCVDYDVNKNLLVRAITGGYSAQLKANIPLYKLIVRLNPCLRFILKQTN